MMEKRKIGAVTVGQSPRTDITADADTFFHGQVEILESGALDSYSLEEVPYLRAQGPPSLQDGQDLTTLSACV